MNAVARLLVVGLPRMLREIVEEALRAVPEVVLVGGGRCQGLIAEIRRHEAAFVIGDADALERDEVASALREFPSLRVLTLRHDGRTAELHELRPHCEALGEASTERLVAIIREHAIAPVAP